jgi:hypothetical protein
MDISRVSLSGALIMIASCGSPVAAADGGDESAPADARGDPPRADSGPRVVTACPTGTGDHLGVWEDITPTEFRANPRLETTTVAVAASNPSVVYASAGDKTNGGNGSVGVFRSTDCGATWHKVNTGAFGAHLDTGDVWQILVDPTNADVVYATNGYGMDPTLYNSTNGGVDWAELRADAGGLAGGFVQGFGMDPQDSQHLVVTYHANCGAPLGPMCMGETSDGGANWRQFRGPASGWEEGASVTIVNSTTFVYLSGAGGWITRDDGGTWEKFATAYESPLQGPIYTAYLGSDGSLYVGAGNTGVLRASVSDPKALVRLDHSPIAGALIDDGTTLYATQGNNDPMPWYAASLGTPTGWTQMGTATVPMRGGLALAYDSDHHLIYSANWGGGLWRVAAH